MPYFPILGLLIPYFQLISYLPPPAHAQAQLTQAQAHAHERPEKELRADGGGGGRKAVAIWLARFWNPVTTELAKCWVPNTVALAKLVRVMGVVGRMGPVGKVAAGVRVWGRGWAAQSHHQYQPGT